MACSDIIFKVSAPAAMSHQRPKSAFTIRWLSGGSYLDIVDHYDVSKATFYRLVYEYIDLIIDAFPISFPLSSEDAYTCHGAGRCPHATVWEDARLAVLPIEMVIMEWKFSQEVGVIHAEGESLEEHILVQGLLVALVGVKLVACWHLVKVL
jgi:hypothetical protein